VYYTGTLDDGSEFDSNVGGEPLVFVLGEGQLIAGFESAVRGLSVGETVTVRMEAADAYGEPDPSLIVDLPSEGAPPDLAIGDQVMLSDGSRVTILAINEDTVTVDANHALAGQALTFEITVDSIG
jgi:FKBP-type peptidyl-prolyl cis-trans isomerase 2